MKKHLVDFTLAAEDVTAMSADLTTLETAVATFVFALDDDQRKRLQRMGLRNETFSREVLEVARQNPSLVPPTIDVTALDRDLVALEQLLPLLFRIQRLARLLEDTAIALGVDLYNGSRGLYKTMKITAEISGLSEIVAHLGERFANQGKRKQTPDSGTTAGSGVIPPPAS